MMISSRWRFAVRYAGRHLLISLLIALASAAVVFGLWYPTPYRAMLGVGAIFGLVLAVDVVCGPLLTGVVASPRKSRRERWLDFSLIGAIQLAALAYGMHSVWLARPAVLAFEADRLVVVTANEVQAEDLHKAPAGLQRLPWAGVRQVGTRRASGGAEMMSSGKIGVRSRFQAVTLRDTLAATVDCSSPQALGRRAGPRLNTRLKAGPARTACTPWRG